MIESSTQESRHTPGEAKPVRVDIIVERDSSNGLKFKLDSELIEGDDDGGLIFDQDRDEMRKLDYYLVEFVLKDRSGRGLTFAPDLKNAFWVSTAPIDAPSPPCPEAPSFDEEIHAIDVSAHTLTVRNENNTIVNFAYSLGFVSRDGSAVRLDPVGSNKDGGS